MAHDLRSKGEFVARRPKSERRRIIIGWIIAFVVIAAIAGLSYLVLLSDVSGVRGVVVTGSRIVEEQNIVRAVREKLSSDSWFRRTIGDSNIFFWKSVGGISGEELGLPAIKSLEVQTDTIGRRAIINVHEREFAGVWCAGTCVGFDADGTAYFDAPSLEGSLLLQINDVGTSAPKLGERVLEDSQQFVNMMETIRGVREAGIAIASVAIKDRNLREWTITPSHGGVMMFGLDVVPERLGNVLKTIMERAKWDNLNYIDFRVANRVYYK